VNTSTAIVVGLALGVRHATDADHVVALATLLRRRSGMRGALVVGTVWGLGHTMVLLAAGVAVVLLGVHVPAALDRVAELAVAVMLVGLGLRHLFSAHHREPHVHAPGRIALRPFAIGMVHGLAGSAGVALLALTTIRSPGAAMLYLSLFGLGTVAGMMLLTCVIAFPLCYAGRSGRIEPWIVRGASAASLALGVVLAVRWSLGA
jgi:high-affinity nickel-transport protein